MGIDLHSLESRDIISVGDNEIRYMLREFFLGFIKLHIVYHASREPVFGLELIRELARHGYALSPGTLYPLLHKLEESGFLRHEAKLIDGKVRKYYTATPEGKRALVTARSRIVELVSEVLKEQQPTMLTVTRRKKSRPTRKRKTFPQA